MWFKLLLLCLYFLVLFIFSRLMEVVSWCSGTSMLFYNSRSLLDPVTLSVKKLKRLLDNRGISYSWAFEKKELIHLVKASGSPGEKEIEHFSNVESAQTTQFSCGSHFYEEVEDTKDSIWLVQVIADNTDDNSVIDDITWKEVKSRVSKFGVRTGMFRCSLDKRLCSRKMWTTSRLILALPYGSSAKDDVVLHSYLRVSETTAVVNWVRLHLASRIKNISSIQDFSQKWLAYDNDPTKSTNIKFILLSTLKEPPLFFSSLAVKFTGRVKFGTVFVHPKNIDRYQKLYDHLKLPTYLIITPERQFEFGTRIGENFVYEDMEFFLKSLHPEMNDVFLWSILLVNALVGFELFLIKGKFWKCLLRCIICVFKYNCLLFLTWLFILTLYRFSFMTTVTEVLLKTVRLINGTNIASILRNDWRTVWSYYSLTVLYLSFGCFIAFLLRKLGKITIVDDIPFFSDWSTFPWYNFISSCFFRPMVTLTRPTIYSELDLEEGMELLIERLAVPHLWLQPMISSDYIKDLPIWKYQGWCDADDEESGKSDVTSSSEDEVSNSIDQPSHHSNDIASKSPDVHNVVYQKFMNCFLPREVIPSSQESHKSKDCETLRSPKKSPKYAKESNWIPASLQLIQQEKSTSCDIKRAPPGMLEFRECSICIESYCYGEMLCGLPCGHNYHMNCIMTWLYRDNHCCPICRWPSYKLKPGLNHLHSQ